MRQSIPARYMTCLFVALWIGGLGLFCGCESSLKSTNSKICSERRAYPSVSQAELMRLIRSNANALGGSPLLVEIGTDSSCFRCNDMTPLLNDLANEYQGRATVVRTEFAPQTSFQKVWAIRTCPTYLLIQQGDITHRWEGSIAISEMGKVLNEHSPANANPLAIPLAKFSP